MNSRPKTRYAVELFASAVCDPSGFGEGQRVLRSFNVTTDRAGVGMIDTRLSLPPGHPVITATATAAEGTSEFSACLKPGGTNTVSAAIAPAGLTPDSSGHVTVDVWCLDKKPCDGTATLQQGGSSPRAAARSAHPIAATASSRTLGSGRFHGRRGGRALKVRIRLTASGKRILAKRKRLNVVAKVKLKGRHGHSAQDSVSFVLAARRRH
jgi:hypothetical protein